MSRQSRVRTRKNCLNLPHRKSFEYFHVSHSETSQPLTTDSLLDNPYSGDNSNVLSNSNDDHVSSTNLNENRTNEENMNISSIKCSRSLKCKMASAGFEHASTRSVEALPGDIDNLATTPHILVNRIINNRKKWTENEKNELMNCYELSQPNVRGCMKRLKSIWCERGNPTAGERYLLNQVKWMMKTKELDQLQLSVSRKQATSPSEMMSLLTRREICVEESSEESAEMDLMNEPQSSCVPGSSFPDSSITEPNAKSIPMVSSPSDIHILLKDPNLCETEERNSISQDKESGISSKPKLSPTVFERVSIKSTDSQPVHVDHTATRSCQTSISKPSNRKQWSVNEMNELMTCYELSQPNVRGSMKRLKSIWCERGNPTAGERYLLNQAKCMLKRKEFSEFQLSRFSEHPRSPSLCTTLVTAHESDIEETSITNFIDPSSITQNLSERNESEAINQHSSPTRKMLSPGIERESSLPFESDDVAHTAIPPHVCLIQKSHNRKQWSVEEKNELMTCYVMAQPNVRGWMKRLKSIWTERGNPEANEKYLANQASILSQRIEYSESQLSRLAEETRSSLVLTQPPPMIETIEENPTEMTSDTNDIHSDECQDDPILSEIYDEISNNPDLIKEYIRPLRFVNKNQLKQKLGVVNESLKRLPQLNDLLSVLIVCKAVAKVVTRQFSSNDSKSKNERKRSVNEKPKWLIRIDRTMFDLFKDLDRLRKFDKLGHRKRQLLTAKYQISQTNLKEVIEICEQKLVALKARKERYSKQIKKRRQNALFLFDRKRLFSDILQKEKETGNLPNPEECQTFWKSIWEVEVEHNQMDWITDKVVEMNQNKEVQTNQDISLKDLQTQLRKTPNWKAPGIDGLHPFWIKNLTVLHPRLVQLMNESLMTGIDPFFTSGRTVLIQKDKDKGNVPSNYRPITCLSIIWKTLTGILSSKIYEHLIRNDMIPLAQKGCIRNSRATKDQLILDKEITKDAKKRQRNLSMAWIDFQKAYDMVPHSWIIESLKLYKVSETVINFLHQSMKSWNLKLFCQGSHLGDISVKRGIFQGDSLSPLLFIMALFPLSHVVLDKNWGYQLKVNSKDNSELATVNHLLYMDDIKLYAKSSSQLKKMVDDVKSFSDRIQMKFGLDKCKAVHIVQGRLKEDAESLTLTQGDIIEALRSKEECYKYLGIIQLNDIKHSQMKTALKREYFKRIRSILQSELHGKHKITSINTLALPVIRYSAGIIHWNKTELQQMDVKTRKLLTCYRGFAKNSNVTRLYLSRRYGGRGLISAEECVSAEESSIDKYKVRCMKILDRNNSLDTHELNQMDGIAQHSTEQQMTDVPQIDLNLEKLHKWNEKPVHGQFLRQLSERIDRKWTFSWLSRGSLSIETEGFVCAAQEQAVLTRGIARNIYGMNVPDQCRLCGNSTESVMHIAAECSILAPTQYLERHNLVAQYIHFRLLQIHGADTADDKWYTHIPNKIMTLPNGKILWDFNIYTDRHISARRPDIVVVNEETRQGQIIDINCPNDVNIIKNEVEKRTKYTELKIEMEKIWGIHFKIIPIVIGCLGAVSTNLPGSMKALGLQEFEIGTIQDIVLKSTCHILRKNVTQSGHSLTN
jgi:hypothetical protein